MPRVLTLLGVFACYAAITFTSLWAAETFDGWSAPRNVGPPLNTAANDEYAVLTRDELTVYLTSDRPGSRGLDLWVATRDSVDSPWNEPQNMGPRVNSEFEDSLPFLSSNEHILYFHSTRAGGCGNSGDIWMTRRRNRHSEWEQPTNLGCLLNTAAFDETAPSLFEDSTTDQVWLFYASDRTGGLGDFDVYASLLRGRGSAGPGILIREFSSPGRDTRIFIRKDGLEAFITSNRGGNLDIWVSTRDTVSEPWSTPTNLGTPVNGPADDVAPWLSKDGTTLYFSSTRVGGYGRRDIWYTTRTKLND
jgi:OmpA-OmpF porin, OOP family